VKTGSGHSEDPSDDLMKGILREIAHFEQIQDPEPDSPSEAAVAGQAPEADHAQAADAGAGRAFTHVRFLPKGANPFFPQGVEFARLAEGRKIEDVTLAELAEVPPVAKDCLVAIRDLRSNSELVPGKNLYCRAEQGTVRYFAQVGGVVVVAGNLLQILSHDADGGIAIRVSPDRLAATFLFKPAHGAGRPPSEADVRDLLTRNKIRFGIQEDAIRDGLEACRQGSSLEVTAALGRAPRPGTPGDIEYFFNRDFQGPIFTTPGPDGKINYRDIKWIPNVAKDQLLARLRPTVPGEDGKDVFGEPIRAPQPPPVYLVAGPNVRAEKEDTEFIAEINGRVQLHGSLLAVMNVYVVNSDVDYRSGNVRFEGNVLITGAVRKGFEVEATGDVVVLQNAEPCRIKAGRDIFIHGGVLGSGKGEYRIEAGRDITAGYAENAWLEAQGDIRIEDFALQSFLYSGGHILLDKRRGSLIGGEAVAARGLEARSLGSQTEVRTLVAVGVNFVVKRNLLQLSRHHLELQEAALKVDRMLKSLLELAGRTTLPRSKMETLRIIAEKRKLMAKTIHVVKTRIAELQGSLESDGPVTIRISGAAFPEVTLAIRGRHYKVAETSHRSIFRLDDKGETVIRRAI
jgi:uncharacterized protein (DUF342 family)